MPKPTIDSLRLLFMGSPVYSIRVLESLLSSGYQVAGVYTQADKPAGRGHHSEAPPVKSFALEQGLDVFQPTSLRGPEVQQHIASLRPDVIVVAAYGKILPREVLELPRYGCLNLHPSLLPKYRGPSPVATALLEGEVCTAVTIMLMDEGMDTGPVIAARSTAIDPATTTESLTQYLFSLGATLLNEILPHWVVGEISPEPQDNALATVTKKLEKSDGEADWRLSAEELERRMRAFTPWPGLFSHWKGRVLKLLSVQSLPFSGEETQEHGHVVSLKDQGIGAGVVTGNGVLALGVLQLEGRRRQGSDEFLRGHPDFLGSKLPS